MKKPYFDHVNPKVNFPEMEKILLDKWYKNGVISKYLLKNKSSKKYFSFLDGPITANNPMGVHHAWGRTYKDIWQRYKNMQGYRQRFQNGFDCQGLWVEVEVEKELGVKSKKDIENLVPGNKKASIDKFVNLCKERVYKYAAIQTQQTQRLGNFMDWENSYFTLSDGNNYMIWNFLKKCHEKGLIYKGTDVVPWCPRCETAISEHEILTEDYKEILHESLFLKFPVLERSNEYLLVWTTTPWTVPANISVAVNPKNDYILAEKEGNKFWVSKSLAKKVLGDYKLLEEVKGEQLVGFKYKGAFDDLPAINSVSLIKGFHEVVATDSMIMPISEDEGTGLVHTSTGTGAEDHHLGKKLGLPVVPTIEDDATYLKSFGFLAGKNAKKHPEIIIEYLKTKDGGRYLYKTEKYLHRYPACWRCKTELVWKLTDEWYISINPIRRDMIRITKNINWLPKFGLKRELDWLSNMHDWLISKKNRYWGLALPIWECRYCGYFEVISGKEELKRRSVQGWNEFEGHSPHKPWIDVVKVKCVKCGNLADRIDDVGNPWLDAGIVTYSTISSDNSNKQLYLTDKKEWKKWIPADFITESFPGQFKNWFYSLIAMSTVMEAIEPFKTVLGFATLLAEDGRPMHKSWGNSIEFNEGAEKIGVDVMRWMYTRQNPAENLLFGYHIADEVRRKFHLKIWNVYNFFITYANLNGWKPDNSAIKSDYKSKSILDIWILARLNQTLHEVTEYLDNYDAYNSSVSIEAFVDDLSNWYIRRSRERVGFLNSNATDKEAFFYTSYNVLVTLCKILAPFTPFISDYIYTNLTKDLSVHLISWPEENKKTVFNNDILISMKTIREIVEKVHAIRKDKNITVRQPLKMLSIISPEEIPINELVVLMADELNVKKVEWQTGKTLKINLDTNITSDLVEEAKTRDLIRRIQDERKNMGIKLAQKIIVENDWQPESKENLEFLMTKTLTTKIVKGDSFKVKVN